MHVMMDFGTANFRATVAGQDVVIDEPCVVVRKQYGASHVGTEAARMIGRSPELIEITRPIEGGAIKDIEAIVEVIHYAVRKFGSSRFSRRFSMTIAVSPHLTSLERKAFIEAGKLAGAKQVELVNSSTTAARGAGLPIDTPTGCIVVNLGAATTEAALLSMRGVVDSQRIPIGGRTIDHSLMEIVRKEYSFLIGERSAEALKFRFSEESDGDHIVVKGRNLRTGLPDTIRIARTIVETELNTYYQAIVALIVQTIATCPPELVGDIVERGIVLVGGGARIADIEQRLALRTDVPVVVAEGPDQCVIRGLVQQGWSAARTKTRIKIPMIG